MLFYVACPYGSLRLYREGPAMKRSSLMHRGTLHPLIQSTDKERKGPAARMAGAPNSFRVHLGPGQEVVDGAHAIPDVILRQVISD